jgi:hypothetical protein
MKYTIALSAAALLAASAGVALADPPNGQYTTKSTVTNIGTGTNATICGELQQAKGNISYNFTGYTASTASATGALAAVADLGGTYYVEDSSIPMNTALVGSTVSASVWSETFNNFGQLVPGSNPVATLALTTKKATQNATHPTIWTVVTARALTVTGLGTCKYSTTDVWTQVG